MKKNKLWILFVFLFALIISNTPAKSQQRAKGVLYPTSAWLVGENYVDEGQRKLQRKPCTMVQQFDNGYLFRFTATDTALVVFAIDFRKSIFQPGQYYRMHVQVSPSYVEEVFSKAINDHTLLINVEEEMKGFLPTLKDNQFLRLRFDRKKQDFSLLGIEKGLERMAQCYRDLQVDDSYNIPLPPGFVRQ